MSTLVIRTDRGLIGQSFVAAESSGLIDLPGWLRIRCDTAARTSQQSVTTLQSGYAAHAPRAYSSDGTTFGLLVEPLASNLLNDQDFNNWVPTGTPLINSVIGPDGSTGDYEVEDDFGLVELLTFTPTPDVPTTALVHTLSTWHLKPAASGTSTFAYIDAVDDPTLTFTSIQTEWAYADVTTVAGTDAGDFIVTPRILAGNQGAIRLFGLQYEQGSYPTSFHAATRLVETLEAVASAVLPDGLLLVDMSYRPHYADDEAVGDHNLFFLDVDNRVFYRESDDRIVFRWNADDLVSAPITFARHDTITLFFENSAGRRRLTVNGVQVDGTIQPTIEALDLPTYVGILGGASGAEEGADLLTFDPNVTTFCELAEERVLVQMDDAIGNRRFRDLMCTLAIQPAIYFDVITGIKAGLELETAIGAQLDLVGAIVGLPREGFGDDRYRVFLSIQIDLLLSFIRDDAEWIGTIPNILKIARTFITAAVGGTITYTLLPPYSFKLDLPVILPVNEILLLFRFLKTAVYAAVLGYFEFPLSADTWGSDSVVVATAGTWGSASVGVPGASIWDLVVTTQ